MQQSLTPTGHQAVQNLAQRYGVSVDAVTTLLAAVSAGGGSMAQFYHPELGGGGQWMRGGMTMVGDMFNSRLQGTVSGLCSELSSLLGSEQVYAPAPSGGGSMGGNMLNSNGWWPAELGSPSSSGGQNDSRYAYFPQARRLAINRNGQVALYDTLDHQIGGVQQQQGGNYGSLSFSSQFGTFTVDSLPLISPAQQQQPPQQQPPQQQPWTPTQYAQPSAPAQYEPAPPSAPLPPSSSSSSSNDIIAAIERLGQLRERGILTDDEFSKKKAELLSRL